MDDFFNIKPMIESWDLGYEFKIVKPVDGAIILETMLIAEVPRPPIISTTALAATINEF